MDDAHCVAIERRIEGFMLGLGAAMTVTAAATWSLRAGAAVAIGTALCWLNFRWLRQGAAAVIRLGLAQAGAEIVRVPKSVHVKFFGRLGLLLVAAYVILAGLRLPAVAFLCGLVAVVPAIVLELFYELLRGEHRSDAL